LIFHDEDRGEKPHFQIFENVSQKLRLLHLCLSKDAVFFSFLYTHIKKVDFLFEKALNLSSILRKLLDKLVYV